MYIRSTCTQCDHADYHNVVIWAFEERVTENACKYAIDHIEVTDTVSEEELATRIIMTVHNRLRDGITIEELCKMIKELFGVAGNYCCDIIQKIKLVEGMYSPDRRHLYYAV